MFSGLAKGCGLIQFDTNKRRTPNINVWLDVKSDMEIKIIRGVFKGGERLPSIAEIASLYNVGISTAQKSMDSLSNDGLLLKKQGKGYFVIPLSIGKLINKHKAIVEDKIKEAVEYGRRIELSDEFLLSCLHELLKNKPPPIEGDE